MISAADPSGVQTAYGYDNSGNRTRVKAGSDPAVTTTYDEAGLAASSSDGTTYTNDAAGNLISVNSPDDSKDRCFFYDAFGNQRSVNLGSTTGCDWQTGDRKYSYDGLDRQVYGGSRGLITYAGTSQDIASTSSPSELYYFTPFGPYGDVSHTYITDLHGDLVGTTDSGDASTTGSKLYSPWGEPTASTGTEDHPYSRTILGFQGQPTDAYTGFVDMQTRLYDPAQGRFTTRDSLFGQPTDPASMNQFGYANLGRSNAGFVSRQVVVGEKDHCGTWYANSLATIHYRACLIYYEDVNGGNWIRWRGVGYFSGKRRDFEWQTYTELDNAHGTANSGYCEYGADEISGDWKDRKSCPSKMSVDENDFTEYAPWWARVRVELHYENGHVNSQPWQSSVQI